ncbi:hypothetical protein K432DRAFT_402657 [Lepidopterella palustris CBS 459.81]|uniref:Uncharacterized protein n=1 Tax=Lepidopterella palustris CBS 459.81 TaxID=1314670 RepID=A0A8E2EET2_9PEZI|nr:hypothetical protein K432DRAFT_402657 [Lepidopterella palustris CBS 459.81]
MDRSERAPQPTYYQEPPVQQSSQYRHQGGSNPQINQYQSQGASVQQSSQHQPIASAVTKEDPYSHVKSLPLFPIYAQSDTDALNKAINRINRRQLPRNDIHSPLANASADLSMSMQTRPRITLILTRYATTKYCEFPGIIVDVVETRGNSSWQGNGIRLRTSRECCIMVRDKWKIRLKAGSMWSKNANWKPVETISVEAEKDKMVPLGIVERWQRPVAVAERMEIWRRFEKDYKTPAISEAP